MEADPLEIARAWATPGYCRSCLREQATEADWKHKGGCECARCASLCWEERGCFDERGGEDPQGTLARALLAKHAEVSALEGLLRECSPYIVSYDSRAIPSEDAAAEALLSRLDAALTPDRKD